MAGELSTKQVLLLNNLMYMSNDAPLQAINELENCWSVGDIIRQLNTNIDQISDGHEYGSYMTGADWKNLINAIESDSTLMNVQLQKTYKDPEGGGISAVFVEPRSNEAIIVFRGTAAAEWKDNFIGGGPTDTADGVSTPYQESALAWYESLDLSGYDTITVSGHSKGGNKAKYITLMDDSVDRCLSFDGQGFSDEFMEEYAGAITMRQHKIENHNVDNDYVNLLLNDIGETYFYEGQDVGNFLENHCPNTFFKFDKNGGCSLVPGERSEDMAALDDFLNGCLRSLPPSEKKEMLALIGELADVAFNSDNVMEDMLCIMMQPDSTEYAAYLAAYLSRYAQANPHFADHINAVLDQMGLSDMAAYVNGVNKILQWEHFDELFSFIGDGGALLVDALPKWMIEWVLGLFNISLTKEQLAWILQIAALASDEREKITIEPDSGADIALPFWGNDPVRLMVHMDTLISVADRLQIISNALRQDERMLDSQRQELTLVFSIIRLRLRSICRKLEQQEHTAHLLAKTLQTAAFQYREAEKAACALAE